MPIDLFHAVCSYFPGTAGYVLRYLFWKKHLKYLGSGVKIDTGVHFRNPHNIVVDDNCVIERNVLFIAGPPEDGRIIYEKRNLNFPLGRGDVYIGKMVHIAPNCVLCGIGGIYVGAKVGVGANSGIYSFSHHYRNLNDRTDQFQYSFSSSAPWNQQAMILGPVFIGDYSLVGFGSAIFPGTSLGQGCVVAAGSVVTGIHSAQSLLSFNQPLESKSLSHLRIKG